MAVNNSKQHPEELLEAFVQSLLTKDKETALRLLSNTEKPGKLRDNYNWTLLHYAAKNGWPDVSRELVEIYKVDPHAKDSAGRTALHYACSGNHTDTVKYLVNHAHCNPLIKNDDGYTPFGYSKGESRDFLQDIIDKAKKEGLSVVKYTKSVSSHGGNHPVIDYIPYLERAAAQGTVTTRLSSIGLFGAAGTGKTSTARLLTDQEPVHEHDSTPVMKPEEYYKATDCDTGDGTNNANEDCEWDSESDEPAQKPKVQQRVRAAKQEVLIAAKLEGGTIKEWMPATQKVLIERFGNCVATLAAQQQAGTTQGASSIDSCSLIEGFSMDKKVEVKPISGVGGDKAGASVTHHTATQQNDPFACVSNITQSILDFVKSREDLQKLGITHFVSLCDTGGQAAFLDVAPALLSSNSVNLVLLKLNERLNDPAKFFYSVNGKIVGYENRQITTRALVRAMVSSKSKIMPPRIKGKLIKGTQKPVFMILGTHLDEYKKMEATGECLQSKEGMNAILENDLSDFKDCIYQRKNKMMFTLNTKARDPATKKLASIIREKVMERYVEVEIPASWYIFHLAMLKIKQSNKDSYGMISLFDLYNAGAMLAQMPPEEVQAALQYFHDLHISLYYPTVASNVVFTDPQFLFDKISEIFALSQGEGTSRVTMEEFDKLTKYGKFNESILGSICKGFSKIFSESEFLSLLCHLFIVSKIPDTVGEYFMPSVLAEHPNPCAEFFTSEPSPSIEPLLLSWNASVPNGLFTSLTTSIQSAEGVNNIHFTMSPSDEQYRNRITLNCPNFGFKVRLIECTTFFAVAALVVPSEKIAKHCVELRRVILSCIGKIRELFNWMPLLAYPEEALLCRISQCISQDGIHFCHLDASRSVISCAKDNSVRAPVQPDSHLVWWGQTGNPGDPSQSIRAAVIKALDTRLDSLSYAAAGSIDSLSRKLYSKSLIPEPVKDDPTKSFDSLLRCFKACIKLEQSSGNVTRKVEDFLTALEEIGGGLATAADAIKNDINKELGSASPFMTDHIETPDTFEVSDTEKQSQASPHTVDKSATTEAKADTKQSEVSPSAVDKSTTTETKATKQSQTSRHPHEIEEMTVEVPNERSQQNCCTLF